MARSSVRLVLALLCLAAATAKSPAKHLSSSAARAQADAIFGDDHGSHHKAHTLHAEHRNNLNDLVSKDVFSYTALEEALDLNVNSTEMKWFEQKNDFGVPYLAVGVMVTGFAFMATASVFFLVLAVRYDDTDTGSIGPLYHYIVFFITSIAALSYYCMWHGLGYVHVGENNDRLVFLSLYADRALTTPLILTALGFYGKAPLASIFGLIGCDLLLILCELIGALLGTVHRYFWWGAGMVFFGLLVYILMTELRKSTQDRGLDEEKGSTLTLLTLLTVISWTVHPLLWLLGQEGTGLVSLNTQVTMDTLADLTAKLVFGLILVFKLPSSRNTFSTFV